MFVSASKFTRFTVAIALTLFLAGCETAEERAEGHFAAAQELVAENDTERALVELRNVFKLDNQHKEARRLFGSLLLEQGRDADAYRQYLRLVEQFPEDVDGLRVVSEIALQRNDWDAAERYIPRGFALRPDDISFRAMNTLVSYLTAVDADDAQALATNITEAQNILSEDDTQYAARQVIIDSLLSNQQLSAALEEIDIGLAQDPKELRLHEIKLRVLNGLQDNDALGQHLETMISQFLENEQVRTLLIRWYLNQDKLVEAQAFLRKLAVDAPEDERREKYVTLIQFMQQTDGPQAAAAEVDARIASGEDIVFFRTMRAAMNFDSSNREAAIDELQDVIATSEPSDDVRDSKATLAKILESTNDNIGAQNLVEEILAENERQVSALQMKAAWQIEDDLSGEAIQTLRIALDQEPRNAASLTLMARAHLREGSRDLAGERLALAVEVSGNGVAESLRYARFLIADGRAAPAEEVLVEALRRSPGNLSILETLGGLFLQQSDWLRVQNAIAEIRRLDTPQAEAVARNLQTSLLQAQGKTEESITYLQNLIESGDSSLETAVLVIQGHLRNGDIDTAQSSLATLLSENPDNTTLRLVSAGLQAATGEIDAAEDVYEAMIAEDPANNTIVLALYTLLNGTQRSDDARRALDAGIEADPNGAPQLQIIKADLLAQAGNIDDAITIYEALYDDFSDSVVIANNFASLIATYRDDPESLERAAIVARRLRGSDIPAIQDTYGWIEYRRGNFEEAVKYLEPAAAGLSEDPIVQLHLGLAYVATDAFEQARVTLQRALDIAGDADIPRMELAREALENLPPEAQ